jgi:copper type II ascorbate-dependent monooxygenase-like protein
MRRAGQLLPLFVLVIVTGAADEPISSVTFNKDVLPILQKNCQSCHRPGQIAPMSFLDYKSTRPWAKAMKAAVASRKMPPWFADPGVGHFRNVRTLAQPDIEVISQWADSGAPEGNPKDAPVPVVWPDKGWQIKPDLIVDMPEFKVPAKGILEWTDITIPSPFEEDTWITSMEILPDHVDVIHHIGVLFRPHTPDVQYYKPEWAMIPRDDSGSAYPRKKGETRKASGSAQQRQGTITIEASYVPGISAFDYRLYGAGKLVPAGTDLVFSMHYTPNGKEIIDHSKLGFTISKKPPERRYMTFAISSPTDADTFAIPPNSPNWESPTAEATFLEDCEIVWMQPHMHLRGKDMEYTLEFPDGTNRKILSVSHYDFNWQLGYEVAEPIKIPKGTKIVAHAHFDNSANNKFNPDPNRTVYYGNQNWEEMMQPWFAVILDKRLDPKKILKRASPAVSGA